jgi:hypothetical protein
MQLDFFWMPETPEIGKWSQAIQGFWLALWPMVNKVPSQLLLVCPVAGRTVWLIINSLNGLAVCTTCFLRKNFHCSGGLEGPLWVLGKQEVTWTIVSQQGTSILRCYSSWRMKMVQILWWKVLRQFLVHFLDFLLGLLSGWKCCWVSSLEDCILL